MERVNSEVATLAGGCFWCTEAVFKRLKGVTKVVSGYSGGDMENPSYEEVSNGDTGHTESIQVTYDPEIISYEKILEVFWAVHDPTTLNRQGADVGTQYRSAIFYHNENQKKLAEESIDLMERSGHFKGKVVTEVKPFTNFYKAEDYHQNYYDNNKSSNPYCPIVITPKIQKLLEKFNSMVKEEYK